MRFCGRLVLRPFNPPRGVLGPFGSKVGNGVENEFPGPRGSKKLKTESKKSQKSQKRVEISTFLTLFRLSFNFLGPRGRRAPGTHFQLRFQLWAWRAQELFWGDWRVARLVFKPKESACKNQVSNCMIWWKSSLQSRFHMHSSLKSPSIQTDFTPLLTPFSSRDQSGSGGVPKGGCWSGKVGD